jgi:hypothetical protein
MNRAESSGCFLIFTYSTIPRIMVIELKQDATPEDVRVALEKINAAKAAERQRKRLAAFGAWKNAGDGMNFQQEARNDWR